MLGISLGARVVGMAVFEGNELIEWKVKSFKEAWSEEKQRMILAAVLQVCALHNVRRIVVKKISEPYRSPQLVTLMKELRRQAKRQHIRTKLCSLSELDYDTQSRKRSKRLLTEEMVKRYPELHATYLKARSNRQEYYTKMFEAVALAEIGYI